MNLDKARRLIASAKGLLEANPPNQSSSFDVLCTAYERLHQQISVELSNEAEAAEFLSLFPEKIQRGPNRNIIHNPGIAFEQQQLASTARGLLGQLIGWLSAPIDEAERTRQGELEAEAYGKERARLEREHGFQP